MYLLSLKLIFYPIFWFIGRNIFRLFLLQVSKHKHWKKGISAIKWAFICVFIHLYIFVMGSLSFPFSVRQLRLSVQHDFMIHSLNEFRKLQENLRKTSLSPLSIFVHLQQKQREALRISPPYGRFYPFKEKRTNEVLAIVDPLGSLRKSRSDVRAGQRLTWPTIA